MKRAIYRESGTECVVDVLEDDVRGGVRTVKLRCVSVLRVSLLCPMRPGIEWTATHVEEFAALVGWELDYEYDDEQ